MCRAGPAICECPEDAVFVFGSNETGRHGLGAAAHAYAWHGAIYGQGYGPQGMSFGIPTKSSSMKPLQPQIVQGHVSSFLSYAKEHRSDKFFVTALGTGLTGYGWSVMGSMFKGYSRNVILPKGFEIHAK